MVRFRFLMWAVELSSGHSKSTISEFTPGNHEVITSVNEGSGADSYIDPFTSHTFPHIHLKSYPHQTTRQSNYGTYQHKHVSPPYPLIQITSDQPYFIRHPLTSYFQDHTIRQSDYTMFDYPKTQLM